MITEPVCYLVVDEGALFAKALGVAPGVYVRVPDLLAALDRIELADVCRVLGELVEEKANPVKPRGKP